MTKTINKDIDFSEMKIKIKENHLRYARENMVTYIEMTGGIKQTRLIKKYSENIGFYRTSKERYLNSAIQQVSLGEKAEHCALAVLLGIGVGGAAFIKLKSMNTSSPLSFINPMDAAKDMVGGAFSGVLGASAAYLIYESWLKSANKPVADDFEHFQAAMNRAGFTNKKYASLSAELVKLFHYRECILLNLNDGFGTYFRDEYLAQFSSDTGLTDVQALNIAIEAYFLDELNQLFNKAFQDIYIIQEEEIVGEIEQIRILRWMKSFFECPESRFKFTQQLQIHFMEECLSYLEIEMVKPTFLARHPYLSSCIMGLMVGAIALTLACPVLGCPLGLSIASIALIASVSSVAISYCSINYFEFFKYQRDKKNRLAIKHTIENVTKECLRLNRLIKNTVATSADDILALTKYRDSGYLNGFLKVINSITMHPKEVAMGSSLAWLREYASRYRHSKGVENDLAKQHQAIIEKGNVQTRKLQDKLFKIMTSKDNIHSQTLTNYVLHTREYLLNPSHNDFIIKFELIAKIKQQILEIIAVVPENTVQTELPALLVQFYTDPVELGGLGGFVDDLMKVRELAGIIKHEPTPNSPHPYQKLLQCTQAYNDALSLNKNYAKTFNGDMDFRELLGLRIDILGNELEFNVSSATLGKYLENSYNFLYSLNELQSPFKMATDLDLPMTNSKEFILYRMLLLKQLAKLADPNNLRVGSAVRRDIYQFVSERFNIDPVHVFDDLVNQTLFVTRKKDGPRIKGPVHSAMVNDLEWVADALRLDLAYASQPITPRMLINRAGAEFLLKADSAKKIIFSYGMSENFLVPESTELYFNKLKDAIASTTAFISYLESKVVINNTGTLNLYKKACITQVEELLKEVQALTLLMEQKNDSFNPLNLNNASKLLTKFKSELLKFLPIEMRTFKIQPASQEMKLEYKSNPSEVLRSSVNAEKKPNHHFWSKSKKNQAMQTNPNTAFVLN